MNPEAKKIVDELHAFDLAGKTASVQESNKAVSFIALRVARLHVILAEEQEKAAAVLERQTETLISLTRSLKLYTILVFVLTGVLVGIETFHFFERRQRPVETDRHAIQTNHAPEQSEHN